MTATLSDLEARLAKVEMRLAALESSADSTIDSRAELPAPTLGRGFAAQAPSHIGRVLLIFGGAFLLRALTESQYVPVAIGLTMGAAYAVFWLFMAYRLGGIEQRRVDAAFFGGTSVVLALPLLHEATTSFPLLSGIEGVVAVAVYCSIALVVAALRDLRTLAWLTTAGGIVAAVASLVASRSVGSVSIFLLLLGLGSLWAVYWRGWMGLNWLGALGADLGVLALVGLASSDNWSIEPKLPFLVGVILLASYLLSFAFHSHVRGRLVGFFESAQALIAGSITLGAAILAVRGGHMGITTVGLMGVVLGVGGYLLAVAPGTRDLRYRNFFYYSTFGLVFLLAGSGLLIPLAWAAVIWSLLAVVMAWFSGRLGWVSLSLQCTFLLLAAGAASGLLAAGLESLVGDLSTHWSMPSLALAAVALATVACLFIPVAQHSDRWGSLASLPQLLVLALSVWEVGGLIIAAGALTIAGAGSAEANPAIIAAIRTAVLSVAAVTLAISSRHWRWPEARWLVYPVLVLVGIKLFVEDFPNGQPASLFVALGFAGTALLIVGAILKQDAE